MRLYAKRYDERPQDVADEELTLGTIHDEEFGLGHLPLDASAFESWKPELIRHTAVDPEELEGYVMWRQAEDEGTGGVWGRSESGFDAGLLASVACLFKRAWPLSDMHTGG